MRTGLTKRQKTTGIFFDEQSSIIEVQTHNTDLKKRLGAYAQQYPGLCRQTDDDGQGGCDPHKKIDWYLHGNSLVNVVGCRGPGGGGLWGAAPGGGLALPPREGDVFRRLYPLPPGCTHPIHNLGHLEYSPLPASPHCSGLQKTAVPVVYGAQSVPLFPNFSPAGGLFLSNATTENR